MTAIANNTTKFSDEEIWTALIEVEKTLSTDIGLDYFYLYKGRFNIYSKDSDTWLGRQDFSLAGVENLTEYFTNLLSEHRKVAA